MKKVMLVCAAAAALMVSSCNGFKSEVKPLTKTLVTFTAPAKDGKTPITGVREDATGKVLVAPGNYKQIAADENIITCQGADEKLTVFTLSGEELGTYASFALLEKGYYLATNEGTLEYYFPKTGIKVAVENQYKGEEYLFVCSHGKWNVLTYGGKSVWIAPSSFTLIKNLKSKTEDLYVAVPGKGKNPSCIIYSPQGKELKKLTPARWRLLLKKLKNVTPIGTSSWAEVDDIGRL